MQQMKLCTSDIPINAIAGQRMDIAVADFMHSHMLPFSLTECPRSSSYSTRQSHWVQVTFLLIKGR
jgi:hypothetical protein